MKSSFRERPCFKTTETDSNNGKIPKIPNDDPRFPHRYTHVCTCNYIELHTLESIHTKITYIQSDKEKERASKRETETRDRDEDLMANLY